MRHSTKPRICCQVYVIIEALADGAVRMGLPRDQAYRLAAQTVLGAGSMVLANKVLPTQLKDNVTSPAGNSVNYMYSHSA
jgi:Pyrroline-5-carboxylate reductase